MGFLIISHKGTNFVCKYDRHILWIFLILVWITYLKKHDKTNYKCSKLVAVWQNKIVLLKTYVFIAIFSLLN
jgi:hypothetical protein